MNKKILNVNIIIWTLFILCSITFVLYPQIDLYISSLFYNDGFYLKGSFYEVFFYKSVPPLISTLAIGSIGIFFYNIFTHKNFLHIDRRTIIYIILVLSLAPGLIVNSTFKQNWQRARPGEIKEFGGDKVFTPAFIISDQGGNSFSSGHGAAAFSLLGFALLSRKRKRVWITLALGYGVAVSFARIIAGGHFFSDNVTSFFIVYISTYILHYYIIEKRT
ncbi:phosphatase PAP2 family protein [Sulfurimonas aquatica]|uniref:Phosphatase PAP2 family protein n=1 Tax=Sulfurimonas aquatica TaxID=2672570 RepID=A0A975B2J2_9BACT|nr:phosphatase PAP2 family protein [Sulfurimonas aquatica]QSZ43062.1 phosphatase PAP2 family protein [Sulfurimonas aquatica]